MVYAIYLKTGQLHDVTPSKGEAGQTKDRIQGSFVREYARAEDVPQHCPPEGAKSSTYP